MLVKHHYMIYISLKFNNPIKSFYRLRLFFILFLKKGQIKQSKQLTIFKYPKNKKIHMQVLNF